MNDSIYRINLDIHTVGSQVFLPIKQGDTARTILVRLTEGCKPYQIADGCSARFCGKKPDCNYLYNDCTISGGIITYNLTSQTTACEGVVECEIQLLDADGKQITSPRFSLVVDGTVYNGEEIVSTPEADALKELTDRAENIVNQYDNGVIVGKKSVDNLKTYTDTAITNIKKSVNNHETYTDNTFANALKSTASGATVTLKDVSPLEHEVKVKMSGETTGVVASGKTNANTVLSFKKPQTNFTIKTGAFDKWGIFYLQSGDEEGSMTPPAYYPDMGEIPDNEKIEKVSCVYEYSVGSEGAQVKVDVYDETMDNLLFTGYQYGIFNLNTVEIDGIRYSGSDDNPNEDVQVTVTGTINVYDQTETTKNVEFNQKGDTVMLDTPSDSVHMVLESGDNFTVSGTIPLVDGQDLTALTDFEDLAIVPTYGYSEHITQVDLTYTIVDKVLSWVRVETIPALPDSEPVTLFGSYTLETSGQKIIGFAQVYGLDEDNPASEYPEYDTLYTKVTVYDKSSPDIHLTVGGKNLFDVSQMAAADNAAGRVTYDGDVITADITSGSLYVNMGKKVLLPAGTYTATLIPLTENMSVKFYAYDGSTGTQIASKNVGALDGNYSFTFKTDGVFSFCIGGSTTAYRGVYSFKVLLEQGSTSTEYEPYVEPTVYTPEADGTVKGVKSIYPSMSFTTNNPDVWLDIEYNRDIIKAMEGKTPSEGTITIDQTYDPESENAQSGKAVAKAISNIDDITPEQTTFFEVTPYNNLLDVSTAKTGLLSHNMDKVNTGGSFDLHTYFEKYIPVSVGDEISIQFDYGSTGRHWAKEGSPYLISRVTAYDENKVVLTTLGAKATIIDPIRSYIVPETVKYIRITVDENYGNTFNVALLKNVESIVPYEPYGERNIIKNEYLPENLATVSKVKAFLPKEICVAVGRTIEIYNNQVCPNADKYHFRWVCSNSNNKGIGKALKRKFSITGTDNIIGEYPLTLEIYDDDLNVVWSGSSTLKIVANAISNQTTLCTIGDSLTNGKLWLKELQDLSFDKIVSVGTLSSINKDDGKTYYHEGRSGYSSGTYTNEGDHPFWDITNNCFSWSYYKANSGIDPTAVQIFLGTNDLFGNATPELFASRIRIMVDSIRKNDANIPIFVAFTIMPGNQNGLGVQQDGDGFSVRVGKYKYGLDCKYIEAMQALYKALKSYSNLYFVPLAQCHDNEYNFGAVETPVNPRATQTELLPVEGVHPQKQGYEQMADVMYSVICAHITE